MKRIKFIHGADIHLDSPMLGLHSLPSTIFKRLQESTFRAFSSLIDAAIALEVDFVILAGDLFDLEDRSVRAQVFLRKEMVRLAEADINVYLLFGNHDHLKGQWNQFQLPNNVHIFGEDVEVKAYHGKEDTLVHLYGFSYPERHVYERMIEDYQLKSGADFHIGILHGNLEGSLEHGNYAPFQLKDLLAKNFHYWALGHIHKRTILHENPSIIYPGNTQGRHRKEQGPKGCYLVTINEAKTELQFIETSDVIWTDLQINAEKIESFDALYQICREQFSKIRREEKGLLVNIEIEHLSPSINTEELLDVLQEEEKNEISFVWPLKINIYEKIEWNKEELKKDSDFYGELFDCIGETDSMEEIIAPLYKHHHARKYLSPLDSKEEAELKEAAEKLLIEKLLRG